MSSTRSLLAGLACRACSSSFPKDRLLGVCPSCGGSLSAEYDLARLTGSAWLDAVRDRPPTLWRYRELLPVGSTDSIVTLGEPVTPVLALGRVDGIDAEVFLKDDGCEPTGTFKARGMAVAVSRAVELGAGALFAPSAGNAGVALAAYGARAGVAARVYLPKDVDPATRSSVEAYGATVRLVPGTIREAGQRARAAEAKRGSFDLSTLREPYRVEGKKTMGFEIFERFRGGRMPDSIVYPAGGGTGLVGLHKAFSELVELRLVDRPPRLLAVQPEGCAPLVRALQRGDARAEPWEDPRTSASGLRVSAPFASERVLQAIRTSGGTGITVTEEEIVRAREDLSGRYGVDAALEGAAALAGARRLASLGRLRSGERVLLYNTGRGGPGNPPPRVRRPRRPRRSARR